MDNIIFFESNWTVFLTMRNNTFIYTANISVVGWVRQGDETAPDVWQPISGTIGSAGFSFSVNLAREI